MPARRVAVVPVGTEAYPSNMTRYQPAHLGDVPGVRGGPAAVVVAVPAAGKRPERVDLDLVEAAVGGEAGLRGDSLVAGEVGPVQQEVHVVADAGIERRGEGGAGQGAGLEPEPGRRRRERQDRPGGGLRGHVRADEPGLVPGVEGHGDTGVLLPVGGDLVPGVEGEDPGDGGGGEPDAADAGPDRDGLVGGALVADGAAPGEGLQPAPPLAWSPTRCPTRWWGRTGTGRAAGPCSWSSRSTSRRSCPDPAPS